MERLAIDLCVGCILFWAIVMFGVLALGSLSKWLREL